MKTSIVVLACILFQGLNLQAQWKENWFVSIGNFNGKADNFGAGRYYISGNMGNIFYTHDNGVSWDSVHTPFDYCWYNQVQFVSDLVGYASGGSHFGEKSTIIKSNDGGLSWDSISAGQYGYEFTAMHFVNENTGYLWGDGPTDKRLIKTVNKGESFEGLDLPYEFPSKGELYFFDENEGWIALTEGPDVDNQRLVFARTVDGGINWSTKYSLNFNQEDPYYVHRILFKDKLNGYAAGNSGMLYVTNDGGENWSQQLIMTDSLDLVDIQFDPSGNIGFLCAYENNFASKGRIYKSKDGGNSWKHVFSSTNDIIQSVVVSKTDNKAFAFGNLNVYENEDITNAITVPQNLSAIKVFPNPSSGLIQVDIPPGMGMATFQLYDLHGKLVKNERKQAGLSTIDCQELLSGIYIYHLIGESEVLYQDKLVLVRK